MSDDYTRHTLTLLFDVPAALAADRATMDDVLNAVVRRITELIDNDTRLQALLNAHGVEFGWEAGSWE
jgi:non-ribosomal peptide synthetase component F